MIRVELDHATVVFTTRAGGASAAPFESLNLGTLSGDDPATVAANIESLRAEIGERAIYLLKQIHGATIIDVDDANNSDFPSGDGLISSQRGKALLVTGADCPPVAIAGPDRVAMLHCGWKPIAAGIVETALRHVGAGPLQAAIGPGIGQANYEVGEEVVAALGEDGEAAFSDGKLSLSAMIEAKLRRAGVERIDIIDRCTFADADEFFSYRRDGAPTGRQAGIAWRS